MAGDHPEIGDILLRRRQKVQPINATNQCHLNLSSGSGRSGEFFSEYPIFTTRRASTFEQADKIARFEFFAISLSKRSDADGFNQALEYTYAFRRCPPPERLSYRAMYPVLAKNSFTHGFALRRFAAVLHRKRCQNYSTVKS
jgi:hypothetical protein